MRLTFVSLKGIKDHLDNMAVDDLRAMTDEDLSSELEDSRRELMNVRFQSATKQLANVHELRKIRKRIAQISTIARERELAKTAK